MSAVFNEDGTAQRVFESGQTYVSAITIFDQYDDYALSVPQEPRPRP
jgi:hypothetical protein